MKVSELRAALEGLNNDWLIVLELEQVEQCSHCKSHRGQQMAPCHPQINGCPGCTCPKPRTIIKAKEPPYTHQECQLGKV